MPLQPAVSILFTPFLMSISLSSRSFFKTLWPYVRLVFKSGLQWRTYGSLCIKELVLIHRKSYLTATSNSFLTSLCIHLAHSFIENQIGSQSISGTFSVGIWAMLLHHFQKCSTCYHVLHITCVLRNPNRKVGDFKKFFIISVILGSILMTFSKGLIT